MKIGIDIRSIGRKRTGDETYTRGLVTGLLSFDEKNEYFLYTDTNNIQEIERIKKDLGINAGKKNVSIVSVLPASKIFWTFIALPKRAKKDNLDILHVQYITPIFLSKGISLVTTIHDVSYKRYPQHIGKLDLFFLNLFIPISLNRAKAVIVVSEFTKKELMECYKINDEKISAISNGRGESGYIEEDVSEQRKQMFRKKKDLNKPYLFSLGTLQPRKNIPFLLESFAYLKRKKPNNESIQNLQLIIGGSLKGRNVDPKIKVAYEQIDDESVAKSIQFIGYVDKSELPLYYQCSLAYINASKYEGFGLPLIESMANETLVICSKDSCYPEVVGDAAIMFENDDKEDFARAVMSIMKDEKMRKNIIEKGKENAKRFSWKKNAMQTLKLYGTIVDNEAQY